MKKKASAEGVGNAGMQPTSAAAGGIAKASQDGQGCASSPARLYSLRPSGLQPQAPSCSENPSPLSSGEAASAPEGLGLVDDAYLTAGQKREGFKKQMALNRYDEFLRKKPCIIIHRDARLIKVELPGFSEPPDTKRGDVEGFSDESRKRLMEKIHTLKRDAKNPAFVTLTFPDENIPSMMEAKVYLRTLFKRWKRDNSAFCGIWRLEAHPERSARLGKPVPHFHLMVWGGWIDIPTLSNDWADIVSNGQDYFWKHLRGGTSVETMRSFRGVCWYVAKYISKEEEFTAGKCGRVWGIFNAAAMPFSESEKIEITTEQTVRVARVLRQWFFEKQGFDGDFLPRSIFVENPVELLRRMLIL